MDPGHPSAAIAASTGLRERWSDEERALCSCASGAVPEGTAERVADKGDRECTSVRAPIRLRLAALAESFPPGSRSRCLAAARRLNSQISQ